MQCHVCQGVWAAGEGSACPGLSCSGEMPPWGLVQGRVVACPCCSLGHTDSPGTAVVPPQLPCHGLALAGDAPAAGKCFQSAENRLVGMAQAISLVWGTAPGLAHPALEAKG